MDRLYKIALVTLHLLGCCQSFMHPGVITTVTTIRRASSRRVNYQQNDINKLSSTSLTMIHIPNEITSIIIDPSSTFLIAETDGWRQYVPLIVSLGVILDILLGSPIANLALGPMRRAAMKNDDNGDGDTNDDRSLFGGDNNGRGGKSFQRNPKERVDSEAVGEAALQKARYSMELRRFLEENKTDEQRYEEIRKKIDAEAAKFDQKIQGDS